MSWLFGWIKRYGAKKLIIYMDELEPLFAEKIKKAQAAMNSIPPEAFAKQIVDEIQMKLCIKTGVNPKDVGL